MPKKVKYRKQQRGRRRGKAWRGSDLSFGDYGLKALEPAWITDRQIEASRVAITRFIKRGGKLWIRIFPDKPFTKKPAETRMGKGKAWRGGELSFGEYGLKALEPAWITDRQIEASRVAITRFIKRGGKLWIRIFPDKPFTKKPAETRMGKGKGAPEKWVAVVKPGRVMFEMAGVDLATAKEAMELAAHKLPIHTRFVSREGAL